MTTNENARTQEESNSASKERSTSEESRSTGEENLFSKKYLACLNAARDLLMVPQVATAVVQIADPTLEDVSKEKLQDLVKKSLENLSARSGMEEGRSSAALAGPKLPADLDVYSTADQKQEQVKNQFSPAPVCFQIPNPQNRNCLLDFAIDIQQEEDKVKRFYSFSIASTSALLAQANQEAAASIPENIRYYQVWLHLNVDDPLTAHQIKDTKAVLIARTQPETSPYIVSPSEQTIVENWPAQTTVLSLSNEPVNETSQYYDQNMRLLEVIFSARLDILQKASFLKEMRVKITPKLQKGLHQYQSCLRQLTEEWEEKGIHAGMQKGELLSQKWISEGAWYLVIHNRTDELLSFGEDPKFQERIFQEMKNKRRREEGKKSAERTKCQNFPGSKRDSGIPLLRTTTGG